MKKLAANLAILALVLPSGAQVCPPGSPDDTAAIQSAVDLSPTVQFEARYYCVDARRGVRIPSERMLNLNGATVGILPGCTVNCKAFETVPGSAGVKLRGPGTIVGDLTPAPGFSIGFRGDSVSGLEIVDVTFRSWRYDGIWLGGNLGTHDAEIRNVTVEDFGRNGLSIVNGSGFTVDRFAGRRSTPATLLGAAVDVEGNPGDQVLDVTITNSLAEDVVIGFYMHAGHGRQGYGWKITNSVVRNFARYGVIFNSSAHGFILDNRLYAPTPNSPAVAVNEGALRALRHLQAYDKAAAFVPVGISVGATGAITANDVTLAGNRVEGTPRSAILAGVVHPRVFGNAWVSGSLATVAPSATIPATDGVQLYVP
ncbi:MAG TPA: right-handed parallel beta-helix repeat-containing protein [Actinomycetes bacterium]|nr:right-handed parallel beta-helix repeat-containing protein [Actinomycetes bacterium]